MSINNCDECQMSQEWLVWEKVPGGAKSSV